MCGPKKSFKVCCDVENVETVENVENVEIDVVDEVPPPAVIEVKQDPCRGNRLQVIGCLLFF